MILVMRSDNRDGLCYCTRSAYPIHRFVRSKERKQLNHLLEQTEMVLCVCCGQVVCVCCGQVVCVSMK